jgi:membrane protease YdiL (CAAX protease family)
MIDWPACWPGYWPLLLLVIAPVLEEIVWRAGLQEALLARTALPADGINLAVAITFALAHGLRTPDSAWAWLTLLPAWGIGRVYQHRRRVLPCIVLHAAMNALWLGWQATMVPMP